MRGSLSIASSIALLLSLDVPAFAQAPANPPPPKIWTVTASAGLALTDGNSDTTSTNAAYDIVYDPHQRNLIKSDGLFLRARTEGDLTANRLGFNVRDQYKFAVINYQHEPRIVRPTDYNNEFWNNQLRAELFQFIPALKLTRKINEESKLVH